MDLFSVGKTHQERIDELKEEIRDKAKFYDAPKPRKGNVYIATGDINNISNNLLIVTDPPKGKFFDSGEDRRLYRLLQEFNIEKYFHTYYYWYNKPKVSRSDIKQFGIWIRKLATILEPKLIVCMGEPSQFSFVKQKSILRDNHGKQIDTFEGAPIFATYTIMYYLEKSEFEDHTYKNYIKEKDWSAIKAVYDEVIK